MLKIHQVSMIILASAVLSACGGGGDNGGALPSVSVTPPFNVALPINGASVSATYGGATASFVNDGDTTPSQYWAGNSALDTVTINFGRLRRVSSLTIYTNDTSFNSGSPKKYIEISADGLAWKKTAQITGGDVACLNFSTNAGKISCEFATPENIQFLRARIMSDFSNQKIIEMEAMGR
jgi:hypothetical protein